MPSIDDTDLEEILDQIRDLELETNGSRMLITGGTGFFGSWLLESWVHNTERLGLDRTAVVVSRDPVAFEKRSPRIAAHGSIEVVRGDVLASNPTSGTFDACLHAATAASLPTWRSPWSRA